MNDKIKIVCAWCHMFMGGDPESTEVSHGICTECSEREAAKMAAEESEQRISA